MSAPDTALVLLERDFPHPDRDPHYVRENLDLGRDRIAKHIPIRYQDARVSVPEVAVWVRDVVASAAAGRTPIPVVTTGPSLMLLGATGTGKTHQAYGAMRALSESGIACRWVVATAADIYARLRPRHRVDSEQEFKTYAHASVLVVDDLGAAKSSEWVEEVNYRLVNYRNEHQLPTLITSNLPPRELGSQLGERVASRLIEMTTRVVLKGYDRRRGHTADPPDTQPTLDTP